MKYFICIRFSIFSPHSYQVVYKKCLVTLILELLRLVLVLHYFSELLQKTATVFILEGDMGEVKAVNLCHPTKYIGFDLVNTVYLLSKRCLSIFSCLDKLSKNFLFKLMKL